MTEWSHYCRYFCHVCGEECINHVDQSRTQASECRACHRVPDLRTAPNTTSERPEGATPSHGGPTSNVSARPQAERRGHSSARKPGGGSPERAHGGGAGGQSESGADFWDI